VVGIRDKKRFHRPNCRYASSKGAEEMTKADARRAGMRPCGICKP
jgi:methylphosphotriester-DNA--protein-cysteine methyltransferase